MAQKSIVLVTVDCLRADHVGFMGYERPTTPFLDFLATESFVLPAAIVAGAPTYYSLPAILASRYPLALGRDVLGLAPGETTLASALKQAGYATSSFSAGNPYISSRFGYEQGFDIFRDFLKDDVQADSTVACKTSVDGLTARLNRAVQRARPSMGLLRPIYDEIYFRYCQRITPAANSLDALRRFPAADVIVDEACRWLDSIGSARFFLWLHLMDPHSPYYPKHEAASLMGKRAPTPFRARYLNSYWNRSDLGPRRLARHREEILALYDAGIRWVDEQLSRLVTRLRGSGRWDHCILAVTADHGEEFLDHDGRYHAPSHLMEELVHVPLLLRVPGAEKKVVGPLPFSLLHLAPTLLDAAEVGIPTDFEGVSYWQHLRNGSSYDAAAISECVAGCTNPFRPEARLGPRVLSIRQSRYKLMLRAGSSTSDLYDLEADPGEQTPLDPAKQKPERRRLLEIARDHLHRSTQRDPRMRLRARLRDLRLEWKKSTDDSSPVAS